MIPIFIFPYVVVLPAPLFLGIWFLIQFFQGPLAITATQVLGVAWWAHVGGFVAGLAVAWALQAAQLLRPSCCGPAGGNPCPIPTTFPNTACAAGSDRGTDPNYPVSSSFAIFAPTELVSLWSVSR